MRWSDSLEQKAWNDLPERFFATLIVTPSPVIFMTTYLSKWTEKCWSAVSLIRWTDCASELDFDSTGRKSVPTKRTNTSGWLTKKGGLYLRFHCIRARKHRLNSQLSGFSDLRNSVSSGVCCTSRILPIHYSQRKASHLGCPRVDAAATKPLRIFWLLQIPQVDRGQVCSYNKYRSMMSVNHIVPQLSFARELSSVVSDSFKLSAVFSWEPSWVQLRFPLLRFCQCTFHPNPWGDFP